MIKRPTTLILGAGASVPFGFPSGEKLRNDVLSRLNPGNVISYGETLQLFYKLDFGEDILKAFTAALLRSGKLSVDSFLEHRPEFIPIGKAAIALELIRYENENNLLYSDKMTWYQYLFNHLNTMFDDFDKNNLKILTFNYDRSLEHYLFTALVNSYGKPGDECVKKLTAVPIIHLHGDLGELPYLSKGGKLMRSYRPAINVENVRIAAERIKIIHEGIEKESQYERAYEILKQSELICFLGFGYHELNLTRLKFNRQPTNPFPRAQEVIGSSFGLTDSECANISRLFAVGLRFGRNQDLRNFDVLTFLREMGILHHN